MRHSTGISTVLASILIETIAQRVVEIRTIIKVLAVKGKLLGRKSAGAY